METLIKTSHLFWYITAACRKCRSGSEYKTGYISPQFHIVFDDDFTMTTTRIKKQLQTIGTIFSKPIVNFHQRNLSVCASGLRDPIAYSLLGGGVPYPEHRLNWSLDSVPIFRFLCFPLVIVWSLPFPPSKIQPGSLLSRTSCLSSLSFCPNCLLSARFCVFSRPPPASGHPSSVRQKSTKPPAAG